MTPIEEPRPREAAVLPLRWFPHVAPAEPLPIFNGPDEGYGSVLSRRASQRELGPLSREKLAALLWHAARVRSAEHGREHHAAPSAGGLHPIHLVVIEPPFSEAHLYDPWRHALAKLSIASSALLAEACLSLREVLPDARGTFVLGVADFERSAAMYEHGESLVWRDAGCLFATLQLTATWLGIGSCIMGIVGAKVAQLISADGRVRPVGAMAFGL